MRSLYFAAPPGEMPYGNILVEFGNETRYDWQWNNPVLVAEATFSMATVLTCMAILRNLTIFEFAGPLQVHIPIVCA